MTDDSATCLNSALDTLLVIAELDGFELPREAFLPYLIEILDAAQSLRCDEHPGSDGRDPGSAKP